MDLTEKEREAVAKLDELGKNRGDPDFAPLADAFADLVNGLKYYQQQLTLIIARSDTRFVDLGDRRPWPHFVRRGKVSPSTARFERRHGWR